LLSGNLEPAFTIFNRYQQRAAERMNYLITILDTGFSSLSFTADESFNTDRDNASWPADTAELDTIWRKRLKSNVLSLKLSEKPAKEIQTLLSKRFQTQLTKLSQTTSEDVFQVFINAYAQLFDPHTHYFSPRVSENFDISMSLSLEGIGALLQTEEEHTKVVRLIPAGPAEKSKKLKPADRIVGVGQGAAGEIVNVIGWRIDDVVKLIRGPKGTVVRLEIIPTDTADEHKTKIISIVRNTVKLEEQTAKKELLHFNLSGHKRTIAVIDLPTFYLDFKALRSGDHNYRSSTRDIQRLLNELAPQKIDGLIIDLRSNSGGLLQEAIELTGLFIPRGPVVQVRNIDESVEILRDPDPGIAYSGPLALLINRLSASASEIFAGAIQDYGRGLIIGERSFGKGTVQALLNVNRGQLKATVAKFYRVSGESTQHSGILPDIHYPSLLNMEEVGESALTGALPWDSITAAVYKPFNKISPHLTSVQQKHKLRMASDPDYNYLLTIIDFLKKERAESTVSLNETAREKERKETEAWRLAVENKLRRAKNKVPITKLSDLDADNETAHTKSSIADDDPVLIEAGNILLDYITLTVPTVAQTKR
ncbi:MAG: tail-specific protease, partial [Deltaproteobacteria bacterium]|nr:tail-specific protease [Deltaproteobacteria bacterium]